MELKDRGLQIQELFSMPQFKGADVLAGASNFNRLVKRVNVMEVPDIEHWVRPGEFLMTTGYAFKDNPELFLELIPKLVKKDVAGLGIKTKRFLDEIPLSVIKLAEDLDFPLIELPPVTSFSDMVRSVMEQVFYKESEHLNVLQERLQFMTQMLLENKKLEYFLFELEKVLGNPIILLDLSNEIIKSPIFSEIYEELIVNVDWDELYNQIENRSGVLDIDGRFVSFYMSPIPLKHSNNLRLVLLEWETSSTSIDFLTIDRVSSLIALEIVNNEAKKMVEAKHLDQFIYDWLLGHLKAITDIHFRAASSGYQLSYHGKYEALLIRWVNYEVDSFKLMTIIKYLRQRAQSNSLISVINGELVCIIHAEDKKGLDQLIEKIYVDLKMTKAIKEENICICRGGEVTTPEKLNESFSKAQKVMKISNLYELQHPVLSIEDLGVYRLLYLLPESDEVEKYINEILGELLDYDQKNQASLIETLDVYFYQNRNMKLVAKALYTHYNTIVYRMDRIKEILKIDLNDFETQLQLYLALKLKKFNDNEKSIGGLV